MGNLTSRETTQLLENESFKKIAANLGKVLYHHGEHEKLRAAESNARHQRREEREEARRNASEPPLMGYFHHYHHHDEPFTARAGPRDGGYYPRRYPEEPPVVGQAQHAEPRNHPTYYNNSAFICP